MLNKNVLLGSRSFAFVLIAICIFILPSTVTATSTSDWAGYPCEPNRKNQAIPLTVELELKPGHSLKWVEVRFKLRGNSMKYNDSYNDPGVVVQTAEKEVAVPIPTTVGTVFVSDPRARNGYILNNYCIFGNRFDIQSHTDFVKLYRTFSFKVCWVCHSESTHRPFAVSSRNFGFLQCDLGLSDF